MRKFPGSTSQLVFRVFATLVVPLFWAMFVPDYLGHLQSELTQQQRLRDLDARARFLQGFWDHMNGRARFVEQKAVTEGLKAFTAQGNPHGREYVVAAVAGHTYVAEKPRGRDEDVLILHDSREVTCESATSERMRRIWRAARVSTVLDDLPLHAASPAAPNVWTETVPGLVALVGTGLAVALFAACLVTRRPLFADLSLACLAVQPFLCPAAAIISGPVAG